ncbi:ABC transporter ATP-binding protein [Oceaniglobus trochenteri]|uniref:ABC transporter ATP-binding protein n=1 Tax=Oceaniglobus trochenteri TaxID=2763260 RepID=UPI001CFFB1F1|nr:ABC transporter ATP-binding protein [Oceaniglobus trochenteri]
MAKILADNSEGQGAAVRLEGVKRSYGDVIAVENVNLDVKPGEFVTLLGPSGSGKSTTLNIIAGFEQATAGEVFVNDQPIGRLPAHKRNMGMVFQHYALFPHMTVSQNVAYPLEERRMAKQDIAEKTRAALDLVKLGHLGDRNIAQLSGGQQQRVALARAIVFSPHILLMDEPLGALDKQLREELQYELKELHRRIGVTVFFVTHDQEEALALSDRIAVFNDGQILQIGTPRALWEAPQSPFVANFIGESNLIPGAMAQGRFRARDQDYQAGPNAGDGAATLLVRPGQLRVSAADGAVPDGHNRITGKLASSAFMGSVRRLVVDCGANGRFQVVEQIGAFSDTADGDAVILHWHPDNSILVEGVDDTVANVFDAR